MLNFDSIMRNAMNDSRVNNNPIARNAMELYQKHDTEGLKNIAMNLCREKGLDVNKMLEMFNPKQ